MAKGRTQKETVAILQKTYPKFNKVAASMAAHPEKYGLCFTADAKKCLGITKKAAQRKKTNRISVRLDDKTYDWFMSKVNESGCKTVQEYLENKIKGAMYDS